MSAGLQRRVVFAAPADVAGREIASIVLREPSAREYLDLGPLRKTIRSQTTNGLSATFDLFDVALAYLRDLAEPGVEVDELLAVLPLAEGIRLQRALAALVPDTRVDDVRFCQTALVFDWRVMSIRDADDMPVSELFYAATRLGEHCKRRADEDRRRRPR